MKVYILIEERRYVIVFDFYIIRELGVEIFLIMWKEFLRVRFELSYEGRLSGS